MPTSWYQVIPTVLELVERYRPRSILDVGVGFGKYGVLLRDALEVPLGRYHKSQWKLRIDGVEVFRGYRNPLHDYCYDRVYYGDIANLIDQLPRYDLILLVDVLEHLEKERGRGLIGALLGHCAQCLLISTPLYPDPQGPYLENECEAHRSKWVITDFLDFDFSYKVIPIGASAAQLIAVFPRSIGLGPAEGAQIRLLPSEGHTSQSPQLTIGCFLPHKNLTGGLKMFLSHLKWLQLRGHRIIAFAGADGGKAVMPPWSNFAPDVIVPLPPNGSLVDAVRAVACDVLFAVWLEQLPDFVRTGIPVVYWEHGHEWLFGELNDLTHDAPLRKRMSYCYQQPCHIASVSPTVARILRVRYGRDTFIIPNGIDTELYSPGQRPNDGTVLLIGNPFLRFKGFDVALRALQRVWDCGCRFRVKWICQAEPQVRGVTFPLNFIVNPPQSELPRHIAAADVFLFTSWYEGFGMPPLEAMACGVPVVATDCGGIQVYAKAGENALLADPGDVDSLAHAVIYLLGDSDAREYLSRRGRETALRFHFTNTVPLLESYLYAAASECRRS